MQRKDSHIPTCTQTVEPTTADVKLATMASFKEQAKAKFDRFCEELTVKTTRGTVDLPPTKALPQVRCLTDGWDWEVQLSRALTCSLVSEVSVWFDDMPHFRNVDPLLPYLQSSPHLRTVHWSSYTDEGFDDHRTRAILNALSENRFIETLHLHVDEPFDCILKSIKTIGELILRADFTAAKMDEIGQVLKENNRLLTGNS
jgi:hypothetical protein